MGPEVRFRIVQSVFLCIIVRTYIDFLILLTDVCSCFNVFLFLFYFWNIQKLFSKIEIMLIHRQARGVYKRRFIISRGQFVNMAFSMNIFVPGRRS